MYLEKYLNGYCCNMGLIRFVAAFFVIYAHSFPLSVGYSQLDLLMRVSGCTMSFGSFAVHIFFISSGLLVTRSLEKNSNLLLFAKKRLIRVFPSLWLVVVLTYIVIGPLFSDTPLKEYFLESESWKYLGSCFLFPEQRIPGLFETNIYGGVINGSLWTLRIEIVCYIFLMFCHIFKITQEKYLKWFYPVLLLGLFLCLFVEIPIFVILKKYYVLLFSFYNGMLVWVYRRKIKVNYWLVPVMLALFGVTIILKMPDLGACLFFPYAFVILVFATRQCSKKIARSGNLSYGVYLCAFPIQQCVTHCFGGVMKQGVNFIISSIIAIVIGWLIYQIGEKRLGELVK